MRKPTKGIIWATVLERLNVSLARPTKGPTASPKPMIKNTRNTGIVFARITSLFGKQKAKIK
jgi:hypothetical protein